MPSNIKPLTQEQTEMLLENYIRQTNNPNIKAGDITEGDGPYYEAEIVTQDGSLVDKIQIHEQTGWFRSVYNH